ncbi:hypothetical protein AKJ16_DCAP11870 [Drosera capensis]
MAQVEIARDITEILAVSNRCDFWSPAVTRRDQVESPRNGKEAMAEEMEEMMEVEILVVEMLSAEAITMATTPATTTTTPPTMLHTTMLHTTMLLIMLPTPATMLESEKK